MSNLLKSYKEFLIEVKEKIYHLRYEELKTVNKELIRLYLNIIKLYNN